MRTTDGTPPAKQVPIIIHVKGSQAQLYSATHDQYFSEMADRSLPDFQQFKVENIVDGPFDTGNYYMLSFLYLLNRIFFIFNHCSYQTFHVFFCLKGWNTRGTVLKDISFSSTGWDNFSFFFFSVEEIGNLFNSHLQVFALHCWYFKN